jgi:prephenate dehydrogenase
LERLGTVGIVGVGLIGGSIGLALRARGLAERVVGIGRDVRRLEDAKALGAIDEGSTEPTRGLSGADVVVVCTPVTRIVEDVATAVRAARSDALITDAGSTKRQIVEDVQWDPKARAAFVGAHPIAGSEKSGAAHARADLFERRPCVLTPTAQTPADRLERARGFWSSLGCRIVEMDPAAHDEALALTSHLPHVVAAALTASVPGPLLGLAGGAYRDGTRVAGSDPALWTGILLANRGPVLDAIDRFRRMLDALHSAIAAGDTAALEQTWKVCAAGRELFEFVEKFGQLPGEDRPPHPPFDRPPSPN